MKRAHLVISGVVQGVFYRASTKREADRLGLLGWVRNLPDGSVEAVAQGEELSLESLFSWCRRGPSRADVKSVEIDWIEIDSELIGFRVVD